MNILLVNCQSNPISCILGERSLPMDQVESDYRDGCHSADGGECGDSLCHQLRALTCGFWQNLSTLMIVHHTEPGEMTKYLLIVIQTSEIFTLN